MRASTPPGRLGLHREVARASVRNKLAYRGNFAGGVLTYGLFVFVFSRIWAASYEGKAQIAGYDYTMSVWYFIVAEISVFGFGRFFWSLADDLKSGQVACLLSKPLDFVGYHFSQAMGAGLLDALVFLAEGIVAGILLAGPPPALAAWRWGLVLVSLLVAGCLQFFLQMSIAMTAFWVEENSAFFWIYQKLALVVGTLLPLEFLPRWTQAAAAWTPLPSLAYAPARIAVAASGAEALVLVGTQLAWLAFGIILAYGIFSLGHRRISIQGG